MPALYAYPQAPDIIRALRQWLGTLGQDRQGEMRVAAARGIALRDICRQLASAIECGQLTVIERTTVTRQSGRIGGQWRPCRQVSQPEQKQQQAERDQDKRCEYFFDHRTRVSLELFVVGSRFRGNDAGGCTLVCRQGISHRPKPGLLEGLEDARLLGAQLAGQGLGLPQELIHRRLTVGNTGCDRLIRRITLAG